MIVKWERRLVLLCFLVSNVPEESAPYILRLDGTFVNYFKAGHVA